MLFCFRSGNLFAMGLPVKQYRSMQCLLLAVLLLLSASRPTLAGEGEDTVEHHSLPGAMVCDVIHRGNMAIPVIILDPVAIRLEINELKKSGPTVALYEVLANANTLLLVNGGFFGYAKNGSYIPLGLVRHKAANRNPVIPWKSGGMLASDGKRITIVPVSERASALDYPEVLQSKPVILHDNAVAVRENPADVPSNRVAIATTTDGKVIIVGVFTERDDAMLQLEFASTFLSVASQYRLPVIDALSMDGGSSAHLYIPALKLHFGNSTTYVPNVVMVMK